MNTSSRPGARKSGSTRTRARALSIFVSSIRRFPRTPAAHTTVFVSMNLNSSSPVLILTPSSVASTSGVPIENSMPFDSN